LGCEHKAPASAAAVPIATQKNFDTAKRVCTALTIYHFPLEESCYRYRRVAFCRYDSPRVSANADCPYIHCTLPRRSHSPLRNTQPTGNFSYPFLSLCPLSPHAPNLAVIISPVILMSHHLDVPSYSTLIYIDFGVFLIPA
jgi:hypothetical protein